MFSLQNLGEHLEIALETPQRVLESCRFVLLNEEVADPGKSVAAN